MLEDNMNFKPSLVFTVLWVAAGFSGCAVLGNGLEDQSRSGDEMLDGYLRGQTEQLANNSLGELPSLEEWKAGLAEKRRQLMEMLSLSPAPDRTDLKAVITGTVDEEQFTVEKLHFQSMPGLYVTANLYVPKGLEKPAPAILYVCGHAGVVTNGISYGNKTAYQHHGAWFARNGYVCLTIDTVQLGEIRGLHHGTYREGMWWWNARGYTPAGVEAWNCIRALDYLQSRPEVDGTRLGVTGRSGGGAYSWWVAALDERIKVAAPVAGITDLRNHVVDGVVAGHCDCMFMVNTWRWDYPMVAALVAPRPLLICNSDKDSIFPLDGVVRVHAKVAKVYQLYNATNNLGLLITEGPHKDTQDLQLPVFRWFNRHLKGEDPLIEMAATRFFTPAQLKVFETLPADERTSAIQESFVPVASPEPPANAAEWRDLADSWKRALRTQVFGGWPADAPWAEVRLRRQQVENAAHLSIYEFRSDADFQLRLYALHSGSAVQRLRLILCDQEAWKGRVAFLAAKFPKALQEEVKMLGAARDQPGSPVEFSDGEALVFFAPRGLGLSAWGGNDRAQVHIRRRFMLLGQTLDGMRVWDIRRAIQALRSIENYRAAPITMEARGAMAVNALYASVLEPGLARLVLFDLPRTHRTGPDYLNVLRFLDIPQSVALAADSCPVELRQLAWDPFFAQAVAAKLGWKPAQFRVDSSIAKP